MKKIFSLAVIMFIYYAALAQLNAQTSTLQVVTLKHDSTLTAFYGVDAFSNACNAADTGDVITLSKGSFNGCDIRKRLTVRGAGMNSEDGTIIRSSCNLFADSIRMDGLCFNKSSTFYIKNDCYAFISHVTFCNGISDGNSYGYSNDTLRGVLTNCRISGVYVRTACTYMNSYLAFSQSSTTSACINCIVKGCNLDGYYENCILIGYGTTPGSYGTVMFDSPSTTTYNCVVYFDGSAQLWTSDGIHSNLEVVRYSNIFKNYLGYTSNSFYDSFELTDAAKTTYLGTDSTQVGWYGGSMPFTTYTYPRISNLQVSHSTTTDGQLSVSVTIDDGTTNDE